ncbi:hypothetical protein [Actinoplanes rectilineatus]|uniref:hypothetical protein n=1 Tax=Actinoplanes rectilineatus TaxID=113571 RepID=UPI0005F29C65|nr:hypothetical protein [Actinoplanes rectilineatus]
MSRHHNRQPGRLLAVGAAGLAVVLGGGAYLITSRISDDTTTTAQEIRADATTTAPAASPDLTTATGSTTEPEPATTTASPAPVTSEEAAEIEEGRRQNAKDGIKVDRPATPDTAASASPAEDVKMMTRGSLKEGGIVRVYTAHSDLTGQKELAYVAGGIEEHRDVPCSQTFKFSTNPKPAKRDNLLMCWRTTPDKSVVAIVVDPDGKPSRDKAVDVLEKNWRDMD